MNLISQIAKLPHLSDEQLKTYILDKANPLSPFALATLQSKAIARKKFGAPEAPKQNVAEQVEAEEVKDIEVPIGINQKVTDKLLQVEVSDFKIVGNLETGSVILSGQKLLKSKEELKLKSQKVAFDGDYDFVQDLVGAVSNLINEISLYHKGKSRVDPQLDMFEDQND